MVSYLIAFTTNNLKLFQTIGILLNNNNAFNFKRQNNNVGRGFHKKLNSLSDPYS